MYDGTPYIDDKEPFSCIGENTVGFSDALRGRPKNEIPDLLPESLGNSGILAVSDFLHPNYSCGMRLWRPLVSFSGTSYRVCRRSTPPERQSNDV
jgi:hypothetical protein